MAFFISESVGAAGVGNQKSRGEVFCAARRPKPCLHADKRTARRAFRVVTPATCTTGMRYYGYRYYNPEIGRWVNRDPIGELGGLNLFGTARNNLQNRIDILGQNCSIVSREPLGPFNVDLRPVQYEWWGMKSSAYSVAEIPFGKGDESSSFELFHSCMCECQIMDVTLSGFLTCKGERIRERCVYRGKCGQSFSVDLPPYEEWSYELHDSTKTSIPAQLTAPTQIGWPFWERHGSDILCAAACEGYCNRKNLFPLPPVLAIPIGFSCEAEKGNYGY